MTGFAAAFRAEARDLLRHPLVWIGAAATAVAAWVVGTHDPIRDNGWVLYESGLLAAARTASFFLLGIAAVAVAGERTRGTVRWLLPRPVTRAGFVLGKAAALALLAVVFLAVAVGTSLVVARPAGFGDVVAEAPPSEPDEEGFMYIEEEAVPVPFQAVSMRHRAMSATLIVLPALLTATGLGLLVSCLLASSSGAVMVALGLALPLYYLPEVVGLADETARALPFRAAADFLAQLREFGRRLATAEWPEYDLTAATGAAIAVLGLPLLAALLFSRLDITD